MVNKVRNDNYFQVQGWMVNQLELKGNELMVYAIIYGFSQIDDQYFTGSLQYLADWTNSTKRGVNKTLISLVEKGLLIKRDKVINRVKYCEYKALRKPQCIEQSSIGGIEQSSIGIEQSSTNNIENNIDIDNKENNKKERKKETTYDAILVSYQLDPRLKKTILEFIKMRKLIKSPLSDYALELLIKKLEKMSPDVNEQVAILEQSIQNSWKGVFPLKDGSAKGNSGNKVANDLEQSYDMMRKWAESK